MQTRKEKTRMNKRMTSSLSLLMCGVLLSTSILPTATVFAETTTPTTDSSTPVPTDGTLNTDLTDTSKVPDFQTPTVPSTDTPEETVLTTTRMGSTKQPIQTEETQPATILTGKWGTAPVSFDTETGVLTVSDGQLNNPFDLGNNRIDNIYLRDIKKIVLDGHVKAPENSSFLFYSDEYLETNFKNLTSIEGDLDTSIVTNMRYMFSSKSLLNVDVSKFNTSNVTDTDSMFAGSKIKELDVSTWDTSNVTNTDSMFQGSEVEYLDVSKWNTSALINMGRIFADTQIKELDVSKWNTSNVTDMLGTFFRSNLTKLDISSWDTSNVENTASMFQDTQISYLDLSNFDSSKLITVDNMFSNSTFKTIKFGSKSIFNQGKDNGGKGEGKVFLPHIDTSTGEYTGRWERIDPKSPPSVYESSNDFTDRYDGSQPGTYTWQRATV
ncbi:TPA: BspA family leucine-rich repeat surface protein, partial [Listeria innocua]|nr:BspA family leucine-rich repeat surface protein [Listeria monocytogenes]